MSERNFIVDQPLTPLGDQVISGLSAVKSLTVPDGAMYAYLQAITKNVRWRDSGTNPTAVAGGLLIHEGPGTFYSGDLAAIKFIEVEASAVLFVSYYAPANDAYDSINGNE